MNNLAVIDHTSGPELPELTAGLSAWATGAFLGCCDRGARVSDMPSQGRNEYAE